MTTVYCVPGTILSILCIFSKWVFITILCEGILTPLHRRDESIQWSNKLTNGTGQFVDESGLKLRSVWYRVCAQPLWYTVSSWWRGINCLVPCRYKTFEVSWKQASHTNSATGIHFSYCAWTQRTDFALLEETKEFRTAGVKIHLECRKQALSLCLLNTTEQVNLTLHRGANTAAKLKGKQYKFQWLY